MSPLQKPFYREGREEIRKNFLARQTDGAAVELPPEQAVIPSLWRANKILNFSVQNFQKQLCEINFPSRPSPLRGETDFFQRNH